MTSGELKSTEQEKDVVVIVVVVVVVFVFIVCFSGVTTHCGCIFKAR